MSWRRESAEDVSASAAATLGDLHRGVPFPFQAFFSASGSRLMVEKHGFLHSALGVCASLAKLSDKGVRGQVSYVPAYRRNAIG